MERNVDFPQPDGPEITTYSPRSISSVTLSRARVSSSASPLKVFVMPSKRMSGRFGSAAVSAGLLCFHQAIRSPSGMPLRAGRQAVPVISPSVLDGAGRPVVGTEHRLYGYEDRRWS